MPDYTEDSYHIRQGLRDSVGVYRGQLTQLLESLEATAWAAHRANQDNPHDTNRADIFLDQLENYAVATDIDVLVGEAFNLYITLDRLREHIALIDDWAFEASYVRVPTAYTSYIQIHEPDNVMVLHATPFAFNEDVQSNTFIEREYRLERRDPAGWVTEQVFSNPDTDLHSITIDDVIITRHHLYRWQCRDVSSDAQSGWSLPAYIDII